SWQIGSPMVALSGPQVRQTRDNEVVIGATAEAAHEMEADAENSLGTVKRRDRQRQSIDGRGKFGLQFVKVRASLVGRQQGEATVVIQASSDDIWAAGAKNATKRLVEMLLNLDNPGYQPDRLGMHPAALVGIMIGFVILVVLVLKYVWPL